MTPLKTSLWAATAAPAPNTHPLQSDCSVDVVVVGAGFAGLSTALHLAKTGKTVQVLEAGHLGQGASGRSGGQVIPGIKYDPDDMIRMFGAEAGQQAIRNFGSTADKVFELVKDYDIECEATRSGWVQPAHSKKGLTIAFDRCRQWKEAGADVAPLSRSEVAELLGSDQYHGGWIDRRAGSVQPLGYTRGLARAAMKNGAAIATDTRVTNLQRAGGAWHVSTTTGHRVTAQQVVVCANAYSKGIWPSLERSYIAANSFQIATRPLGHNIAGHILKDGVVASDTRRLLAYFRRDRDGRVIMGGRGTFEDPDAPKDFAHVHRMLRRVFPELAEETIEYRWAGRVAITQDFLPHIHQPDDGLMILVGCQGRGVALQSKMGQWLSDYIATGDRDHLPVPITRLRNIPFHELRRLYVAATVAYYKFRDAVG